MIKNIHHYIDIARPHHWFKNFFMIPGVLVALMMTDTVVSTSLILKVALGFFSLCLIASANYVINEWLDAEFDKFHPLKKNRTLVTTNLKASYVYTEYFLLSIVGLAIAYSISLPYFFTSLSLLFMGFLYNVRPFRTKDKVYLDVISESINNPIRFCLGWYAATSILIPPSSVLIAYWMGGAFLMGTKRFAEYRLIGDPELAGKYRASFKYYTEQKLLISILFYAILSSFFLGGFLVKHKIELILSFPFFAIYFAWYLNLAFKKDSNVQRPESLYKERRFMLYTLFLCVLVIVLLEVDIPVLQYLLKDIQ